jgi:hypothetical protein
MNNNVLDFKLRSLIQACQVTGNYKKLSVVGFILTSNIIDEISIKLGMRPRLKKEQEKLFEYLYLVNEVFEKNLQITIFPPDLVDSLKEVELLFLKGRGDLPYEYIKQLIALYYELRKFEIPNLYKGMVGEDFLNSSSMGTLNFFSRNHKSSKKNENKFKPILKHTINQREKLIRAKLNKKVTQSDLEMAIHLQKIRNTLDKKGRHKYIVQGSLKDSIIYEQSQSKLFGYLLLGVILLSITFGVTILIEMFWLPLTMEPLNHLVLISFGVASLFILFYRNYIRRGKRL